MPQKLVNIGIGKPEQRKPRPACWPRLSVIETPSKTECGRQRVGIAAVEDKRIGAGLDAVEVKFVVHVAHTVGLRIVFILALVDHACRVGVVETPDISVG